MHRNTAIVIASLSLIAALLVGVNFGRKLGGGQLAQTLPSTLPTLAPSTSPVVAGTTSIKTFTHVNCGLAFDYDGAFTLANASEGATLTHGQTQEKIDIICGTDFPLPPLPEDQIEEATVAGQRATIYHDASAKDGKPVDVVVFDHPTRNLEIALFGFGEAFKHLIDSLRLIR